ncbi:hypothetical protein V2J09_009054 [Rumex salicifolius]
MSDTHTYKQQEMEALGSSDGEGEIVVAIALSGGSKSKALIKWAIEKFVPEGKFSFKLLHVYAMITSVPTPMGNTIPLHQVRDDVAAAYKKEVEWQKMEMILPYKKLCISRKVPVEIILIEADDIAVAVSQEIAKIGAKDIVLGASSNGMFSRKVKGQMLSSLISECAPQICTVYVVSKGKLEFLRPSEDANVNILVDTARASVDSSTLDPAGFSSSGYSVASPYQSMKKVEPVIPKVKAASTDTMHDVNRWRSLDLRDTEDALSFVSGKSLVTGSMTSQASGTTTYTTESDSFLSEYPSTLSSLSVPNSSQTMMDMELEMLRMELRHIRGMYTMAQHETVDASRKLSDLSKLWLEEATHLKEINEKGEETKEREKAEKDKTEAKQAKACGFKKMYQRKEAEMFAPHSCKEKEKTTFAGPTVGYQRFAWADIEAGCSSFSDELKIGMGAYGMVYKCRLHHTTVAAKVLHSKEGSQSKQFQQELEILSSIRHPHILLLLGACPEQGCLVYEYMENGSLEDMLSCKNRPSPMRWYERFRIAWEVASALAFLHSSKPKPIIHRDLKPANILLDTNLVSKIGDAGLCTMLNSDDPRSVSMVTSSGTQYKDTSPVGTLCYIDPEYQRTGIVCAKSDVYALGMVILQLLTARPAVGITHVMEDALGENRLMQMMDATAGNWPVRETTELALLALQCAELRRKDRPDLSDKVLPLLVKLKEFADRAKDAATNGPVPPPTHFICPILKDVMNDPCVAADGYTYDRKAIEMWLLENDTSPTTDFLLSSKDLLPNFTLHYAITEWKTKTSTNSWRSV